MSERHRIPLPIDPFLPEVRRKVQSNPCLVLQAAPGSGKTTRVPAALLQTTDREVLVLEPRRLATRLSAERVAEERGEECGHTVGYQMRFEQRLSRSTRLRFLTEGLFLRLLMSDPTLRNTGVVVLDEFHERHLHTDVALALTRRLQETVRPDLKLILMSATLDLGLLKDRLPEAVFLSVAAPVYDVDIEYREPDRRFPQSPERQVRAGIAQLLADSRCPGHVLVFLPGMAEIRRTAEAIRELAGEQGCEVLQLYADAPVVEQRKAFAASACRKVILSTNVAETSVTIEGVTGVVDSGLARIAGQDPWNGLPTLEVRPVSKSSCDQRVGRAGRTAPGVAVRLFSRHDFAARPAAALPEIKRLDLAETVLHVQAVMTHFPEGARVACFEVLPWLDAPPEESLAGARRVLQMLGAIDESGVLTARGDRMAEWPLHPRLSRTVIEGQNLGVGPQSLMSAIILNEGSVLRRDHEAKAIAVSDVSYQTELMRPAFMKRGRWAEVVDPIQARRVERAALSLARTLGCRPEEMVQTADEAWLSAALLSGFADRVAQVRKSSSAGGHQDRTPLLMCDGSVAVLGSSSVVRENRFLIALEAEQTRGLRAAPSTTMIRTACGLDAELLAACDGDWLHRDSEFFWDAAARRARGVERLRYGVLILKEMEVRGCGTDLENVLLSALRDRWPQPFGKEASVLSALTARATYLLDPSTVPDFAGADREQLLSHICKGKVGFAEIERRSLEDYACELLPPEVRRLLDQTVPVRLTLASGRKVQVHYEPGKRPWIEAPLQEFFGTGRTPLVGHRRIPVVVHLLAPNGRPVQVTEDLQSFWDQHYPKLRTALSRRYPKHAWPEDPLSAVPGSRIKRRR